MPLPLRPTLLTFSAVCSVVIFCVSFLPTFFVGIDGVESVGAQLLHTQSVFLSTAVSSLVDGVEGHILTMRDNFESNLIETEDHEKLKRFLCNTVKNTPYVEYSNYNRISNAGPHYMGCFPTYIGDDISRTALGSNASVRYDLAVMNASDWSRLVMYEVDPAHGWREGKEVGEIPNYDARNRTWYQLLSVNHAWTAPYLHSDGSRVAIATGTPLSFTDNRTASYTIDITIATLSQFLKGLQMGDLGRSMIVNTATGEVIGISWDTESIFKNLTGGSGLSQWNITLLQADEVEDPFMRKVVGLLGGSTATLLNHTNGSFVDDRAWVLIYDVTTPSGLEWRIILALDEGELTGGLERQRVLVIVVVIVVFILVILCQLLLGNGIVSSLVELAHRMDDLPHRLGERQEDDNEEAGPRQEKGKNRQKQYGTSAVTEVAGAELAFNRMEITIESFARFVPREVVMDLLSRGDVARAGVRPEFCCLSFCDIESFTRMTESADTGELAVAVGKYFDTMEHIIHAHGGTVDKYIGDCIMSVFGAPLKVDHCAFRGVACALEMEAATARVDMQQLFKPMGFQLRVRQGLACGTVLAGNIGGNQRLNYSVIGRAVNLAARLEPLNKEFDTRIMISARLHDLVEGVFVTRLCSKVRVVGIDRPSRVYEVVGIREQFQPAQLTITEDSLRQLSEEVVMNRSVAVLDLLGEQESARGTEADFFASEEDEEEEGIPAAWTAAASALNHPLSRSQLSPVTASVVPEDQAGSKSPDGTTDLAASQQLAGSSCLALSGEQEIDRDKFDDIQTILRQARSGRLPTVDAEQQKYYAVFDAMVHFYLRGSFAKAQKTLNLADQLVPAAKESKLHTTYRSMIEHHIREGTPRAGFDATYTLQHK